MLVHISDAFLFC